MKYHRIYRSTVLAVAASILTVPFAATAQTRVEMPKNKYKPQDDVRLGREAAAEVNRKFPMVPDAETARYVANVGERLVAVIPAGFRHPQFDYEFRVVNASDLNAFALPGGPMYVNRGMIEKARNEGEMAGVMAHEISHVALRHATAQQTKLSSGWNTAGMLGMIIGGAILGGEAGAQLGMLGAAVWMTKYSREYETQADVLGARIMADAGYDPIDLANVFRTIQGEGRSGAPEWLSSHPDPGNRYEKIAGEARLLNVRPQPTRETREFRQAQIRLRELPRARTMAEIEKGTSQQTTNPNAGRGYARTVPRPSTRTRTYTGLDWVRLSVPANWRDYISQDNAQFSPDGAYGSEGITHGVMMGIYPTNSTLERASDEYLDGVLRGNQYLRRRTGWTNAYIGSRRGYMTTLAGPSPVRGGIELVNVFTVQLRSGQMMYLITVAPENESFQYDRAFRNILNSVAFYD